MITFSVISVQTGALVGYASASTLPRPGETIDCSAWGGAPQKVTGVTHVPTGQVTQDQMLPGATLVVLVPQVYI